LATLNREELRNFFGFVEANTSRDYRSAKSNRLWVEVYGVQAIGFTTYDSKTRRGGRTLAPATYCQRCGIVLPLRNLTIDHQKPQQNGGVEAMVRVFRAAGLTVSAGYGIKNRYLQGLVAKIVGGNQNVLPPGQKGPVTDRYTLNEKGVLYFTMLHSANLYEEMLALSMHHIVNLRPMCGPCNSSLKNSNIIWASA
jgi:hypothetical protein